MAHDEAHDVRYAVGLDLGDGESSLCWLDTTGQGPGEVYVRGTEGTAVVTALGRVPLTPADPTDPTDPTDHPDTDTDTDLVHRVVIGEDAVLARNCVHFSVNFKNRHQPTDLQAVQFAQVFLAEFFARHPEVQEDCVVHVGHPAGWDRRSVKAYLRQLRALDVPVRLVAESQSALVHVRDRRAERPGRGLDRVLVVDVGSSTTDFTVVEDLVPRNLPVGTELGCREIDATLARIVRADFEGADSKDGARFTEELRQDGGAHMLMLVCRRAKEAQFTGTDFKVQELQAGCAREFVSLVTLSVERLRSVDIPGRVVRAPGGWADRFADMLTEVRALLGATAPELVVLTGGGSRMPVVRELCAAAFPEATVENAAEPSLSVTRGLASIGRHSVNVVRFRRDIQALKDRPEFEEAIRAGLVEAFDQAKSSLLSRLLARADRLYANDEGDLDALIRELTGLDTVLADLRATLEAELIPLVLGICRSYGIRDDQFTLDITLPEIIGTAITRRIRALWRVLRNSQGALDVVTRVPQVGLMRLRSAMRAGATPAQMAALVAGMAVIVALPKGAELGARQLIKVTLGNASLDPTEVDRLVTDVAERISAQMDDRAREVERFLR
ncbi:Hsp70 family protein [Streptomyces sp. RK9]|uniref:Hsp70 family protein n=1 Tax=Streptomyces sp. RK9 TaxID=3239284 RepID=UPI003869AB43